MSIAIRTLRFTLGWIIMLAHFASIGAFIVLGYQHLQLQGVLGGVGTVAPLGAVYLAAFIAYVTAFPNGAPDDGNPVSMAAFSVQLFVVGLFSIALVAAPIIIFTISPTGDVRDSTTFTGTIDTLFAGYIGTIFKKLFPFT
jgi:hypothetical protein